MTRLTAILGLLRFATVPALAQTTAGTDRFTMPMSTWQMAGAIHAMAVVNPIGGSMLNVSHAPIQEIGWLAMTMDLPLLQNAETMGEISAGDAVTLMLVKGSVGMYEVGATMRN